MLQTEQCVVGTPTLPSKGLQPLVWCRSFPIPHFQYLGWNPMLGKGSARHLEGEIKVEEAKVRLEG